MRINEIIINIINQLFNIKYFKICNMVYFVYLMGVNICLFSIVLYNFLFVCVYDVCKVVG